MQGQATLGGVTEGLVPGAGDWLSRAPEGPGISNISFPLVTSSRSDRVGNL